jgi:hypothetical protein
MHSSECRKYAEQCLQLAPDFAPEHRKLVLDLADKWLQAAAQLSAHEDRPGRTRTQTRKK